MQLFTNGFEDMDSLLTVTIDDLLSIGVKRGNIRPFLECIEKVRLHTKLLQQPKHGDDGGSGVGGDDEVQEPQQEGHVEAAVEDQEVPEEKGDKEEAT